MLRNVPEPSLFGHECDGGSPGIDSLIAFGAFVIGPDGDLVEFGIFDPPLIANRCERFFSGAIECDSRAIFCGGAILGLRANAGHFAALAQESRDGYFFFHDRALFASVLHDDLVEFGAEDLPGLRHLRTVARGKVEGLRSFSRDGDELDAVFLYES